MKVCRLDCDQSVVADDLCRKHYQRKYRWQHGRDPEIVALLSQYETTFGPPQECYWCASTDLAEFFPHFGDGKPVAWVMDEAICRPHLDLMNRWAHDQSTKPTY